MARNEKKLTDGGVVITTKTCQRSRNVPEGQILVKIRYPEQKPVWKLMSLDEYLRLRSKDDEGSIRAEVGVGSSSVHD